MTAVVIAILVFATASSGAIFKPGAWYEKLDKPGWTPPNWAFPVVWSILYIMIGVSGWIVWTEQGMGAAILFWMLQLVLNAGWSALFFGAKRMDLGFADVVALLAVILIYIALAFPVSTVAALLFLPYVVWVTAAATLNWQVWRMNAQAA
jgi:tryptophan-rich sensory protein